MRLSVAHITFALCALGVATADAHITMIKGAPFKATKTIIVNRPGEEYTVSSVVARNSDGSTHEEIPDNRTGAPAFILISDAPTLRTILLDVKRKVYSIQNLSDASIPNALTPDQLQKRIDGLKAITASHVSSDGYDITETPLGFRTQDGFVEYGTRRVYESVPPSSKLREKIWETWWLPALSLDAEKVGIGTDNKPAEIIKFTDISTKEPDTSLFEIPSGYNPSPPSPSR